jgi:hypothetical protein
MKLRELKMRILNDPQVRTFVLGLYPEGMRVRIFVPSHTVRSPSARTVQERGASLHDSA